jgi:hypothetical protein
MSGPEDRPELSAVPAFLRRRLGSGDTDPVREAAAAGRPAIRRSGSAARSTIDPAALPMPFSRRRLAIIAVGLVAAWLLFAFGREVADAASASDHAAALRQTNAQLSAQLAAIQSDLARAGQDDYVNVAARGDGLGARHEVPFALAAGAPSLAPDAPGSASQRLGAEPAPGSPLEAWLARLFGSG